MKRLAVIISVLSTVGIAFADGGCGKRDRDATQAERDFHSSVIEIMKSALPPVPAGWKIISQTAPKLADVVCGDNKPSSAGMTVRYERTDTAALRSRLEQQKRAASEPFDLKTKELLAQNSRIAEGIGKALKNKDDTEYKRLNSESLAIRREVNAVQKEKDAAVAKALEPYLLRDTTISISITSVNSEGNKISWGNKNRSFFAVPEAAFAYRVKNERRLDADRWEEGTTQLLLGRWEKKSDSFSPKLQSSPEKTTVQSLLITITADEKRAEHLIGVMDLSRLAKLITKI